MKKSMLLLAAMFTFSPAFWAQSPFIIGGAGMHPPLAKSDSVEFGYGYGTYKSKKAQEGGIGYQAFIGIGNLFRLNDYWSATGSIKFQVSEIPLKSMLWNYDFLQPQDLVNAMKIDTRFKNLNLQVSLDASRRLAWPNNQWQVFGGGHVRFKVGDSQRIKYATTSFYTDIVTETRLDSLNGYYEAIVSKRKLDDPIVTKTNYKEGNYGKPYEHVHYGVNGGIRFPIAAAEGWSLKGEARLSHEFKPAFKHHYYDLPRYRFTTLSAGLVFSPGRIRRLSDGGHFKPLDSLGQSQSKGKRMPLRGGQTGLTQHEIFFSSLNIGYYSGKRLGIDASIRGAIPFSYPIFSAFIGPVYRIGGSRFFAKAGAELLYFDDTESKKTYLLAFMGSKYLLPFSNSIGLHLEAGVYLGFDKELLTPLVPALGVGFAFCRFGR